MAAPRTLVVAVLFALLTACADTKSAAEYFEILGPTPRAREAYEAAIQYLGSRTPDQRVGIARAMLRDSDSRVIYTGCHVLIGAGFENEAIPAIAAIEADGRAEAAGILIGYDWAHNADGDDTRAARISIKLMWYHLDRLGTYPPDQSERVKAILGIKAGKNTPQDVESALKDMERKLRSIQQSCQAVDGSSERGNADRGGVR